MTTLSEADKKLVEEVARELAITRFLRVHPYIPRSEVKDVSPSALDAEDATALLPLFKRQREEVIEEVLKVVGRADCGHAHCDPCGQRRSYVAAIRNLSAGEG